MYKEKDYLKKSYSNPYEKQIKVLAYIHHSNQSRFFNKEVCLSWQQDTVGRTSRWNQNDPGSNPSSAT